MIQSLELKNFQAHKQSLLEFDQGLNVIIGQTDSGKSSIIRALKFVTFNRPSNDSIRPLYWQGDTAVTVTVDSNDKIVRTKGSVNTYAINKDELTAFGFKVPEEVQKLINMTDLNFQHQIDAPFLISNTAGEVAQHFNKIAHLDTIDLSVRNIKSWATKLSKAIEQEQSSIEKAQAKLEYYQDLDQYEADLEQLEKKHTKLITLYQKKQKIESLLEKYSTIEEELVIKKQVISIEKQVTKTLNRYVDLKQNKKALETLKTTIRKYKTNSKAIKAYKKLLLLDKPVVSALEKTKEVSDKEKNLDRLEKLLESYQYVEDSLKTQKQKLQTKEQTYHDNYPAVCPFCGNKTG